ncbi:YozE family protein, partial [Staphylococcus aureus]|uniref:YozE family protein n=1 Tax=Staphylococcus aureus TaxID=1280 RepID=UPI00119E7B10
MKKYWFYEFVMRVGGREEDKGGVGEEIFEDVGLGKEDDDFKIVCDYIERDGDFRLGMCVFGDLYEEHR